MANWETRMLCNETYISDAIGNYSNVTITFQIRRTDYKMSGSNNYPNQAYFVISCDGQTTGVQYFTFNWANTAAGTWWTVASRSFRIPHNSDGSKKISYNAYYYTGINPSAFSGSGSSTLTTIKRYAKFTSWKQISVSQTSASFSWSSDVACNFAYKIHEIENGKWNYPTESVFTVDNLDPSKTYHITGWLQRKDNKLETLSNKLTFTTTPIASISNNTIEFNIGESLILDFLNYNNNKSFLRLFQKNLNEEWELISQISEIQQQSYVWNLSSVANKMFSLTPNKNESLIRIECGAVLNGKEYLNKPYEGIAKVTNSNPTISDFTFLNTDVKSSNMLGNNIDFVTHQSTLRVVLSKKATAKNGASIEYYNVSVSGDNSTVIKKINEIPSNIAIDFGSYGVAGNYKIGVEAVDSRGNISNFLEKPFKIYPYDNPFIEATLERLNGFEQQTSLSIIGYVSRVNISGVNKNALVEDIQCRYREKDGSWTIETISPVITDDGNVSKFTYNNFQKFNLDTSKTYEFEFIVTDKIGHQIFTTTLGQGIPILDLIDDGHVLIGEIPNEKNLTREEKLIVGSDIIAKDSNGEQIPVLQTMKNLIVMSETEPINQPVGGIWFQVKRKRNG